MGNILSREDKLLYDLLGRLELAPSDAQEIFQELKNANKQPSAPNELMGKIINKSPLSGKIIGEIIPVLEEFASGKSLTKPHLSHVSQTLKTLGLPEDEFVGIKAQSERPNNLGKIDLLTSLSQKENRAASAQRSARYFSQRRFICPARLHPARPARPARPCAGRQRDPRAALPNRPPQTLSQSPAHL